MGNGRFQGGGRDMDGGRGGGGGNRNANRGGGDPGNRGVSNHTSDAAMAGARIFVGNLPTADSRLSKELLEDTFGQYGRILGNRHVIHHFKLHDMTSPTYRHHQASRF